MRRRSRLYCSAKMMCISTLAYDPSIGLVAGRLGNRVHDTAYTDGLVITRIQTTPGDWASGTTTTQSMNQLLLQLRDKPGVPIDCSAFDSYQCYNRVPPTTPLCDTDEHILEHIQKLVGTGWVVGKGATPGLWLYKCSSSAGGRNQKFTTYSPNIIVSEYPVSCTMGNPQITLRGRVGERAKATTNLNIHCDSQATLRLTLTDKGLVSVGGGGRCDCYSAKTGGTF